MGRVEGRRYPVKTSSRARKPAGYGGGGEGAAEPARGGVAGLDQRAELGEVVARRHPLLDPGDALGKVGRGVASQVPHPE